MIAFNENFAGGERSGRGAHQPPASCSLSSHGPDRDGAAQSPTAHPTRDLHDDGTCCRLYDYCAFQEAKVRGTTNALCITAMLCGAAAVLVLALQWIGLIP